MKRNEFKQIMNDELGLDPENHREGNRITFKPFIARKDGTFIARETFFYRHGGSSDKWAERVQSAIEKSGFKFELIEAREYSKSWPKLSYWEVIFKAQ